MKRRDILKASGTGLATTGMTFGLTRQVTANDRSGEFVGLSYHSLTHSTQGRATGYLKKDGKNRLSGNLKAAGFNIPVKNVESDRIGGKSIYRGVSDKKKHVEDGEPLTFKIIDEGSHMYGYLTRPNPQKAKLGITLHDKSTKVSPEDIGKVLKKHRRDRKRGRGQIKSTGIPDAVKPGGGA